MTSPLFKRTGPLPAATPAAAPAPKPVPQQFKPAGQVGARPPAGLFSGMAGAQLRKNEGIPFCVPGRYVVRLDQVRYGVSKKSGAKYVRITTTVFQTLEDREMTSAKPGSQMIVYYQDQPYPEAWLSDMKELLVAYFGLTEEQVAEIDAKEPQSWDETIGDACAPEQILAGTLLELRVFTNSKGTFTKTKWLRRVFYEEFASIPMEEALRARIVSDEAIQKMLDKEAAEKAQG